MSKRYPLIVIQDMITCTQEITQFVEGYSYKTFIEDAKTFRAVMANVLILGECVTHLDADTKALALDIPWDKIKGTRNRLIREYFDVDSQLLWHIAIEQIPVLQQQLTQVLHQLNSNLADNTGV
jgi:uncharacterized protein with HEPN domain